MIVPHSAPNSTAFREDDGVDGGESHRLVYALKKQHGERNRLTYTLRSFSSRNLRKPNSGPHSLLAKLSDQQPQFLTQLRPKIQSHVQHTGKKCVSIVEKYSDTYADNARTVTHHLRDPTYLNR